MKVEELVRLSEKVGQLRDDALMENKNDNVYFDAYNQGVNMMTAMIRSYLNDQALMVAFGGEK